MVTKATHCQPKMISTTSASLYTANDVADDNINDVARDYRDGVAHDNQGF